MTISLELKLCLSNFSRGIERQIEGYQGTNIILIFTRPVDILLISNFLSIFANVENEADCLSVNSLINRDPKVIIFHVMI